jgi:hypothetical protein
MNTIVPNRMLMRFEVSIPYRAKAPAINGSVRGWKDKERLPSLGELEGHEDFAPVWCCWNEAGLYIATQVTARRTALKCDAKQFWKGDNLRIMLDMRDTRHIKRATRFCHHLFFMPAGGPGGEAIAGSHAVKRAKENAPTLADGAIRIGARVKPDNYALTAHIPGDALTGFDPDQFDRIGFFYILEDRDRGQQSLTIGDEWPWHMDPSLWATAVLTR